MTTIDHTKNPIPSQIDNLLEQGKMCCCYHCLYQTFYDTAMSQKSQIWNFVKKHVLNKHKIPTDAYIIRDFRNFAFG